MVPPSPTIDSSNSSSRRAPERDAGFLRLYTQHQHQIYAYILALVRDWSDADEVMQETSVALWENFDQFETGSHFATWACRIAYYRVLRLRQKHRRDRHEFVRELPELVAQDLLNEVGGLEPRRMALAVCLEQLRPEDRALVQDCYAEGATMKAVAQRRHRPVKRVYRALARIRRALFECITHRLAIEEAGA